MMPATSHTYPSFYPPGTDWALDEAWKILDQVRPGLIQDDVRAWLAGAIGGRLRTIKRDGASIVLAHVAARHGFQVQILIKHGGNAQVRAARRAAIFAMRDAGYSVRDIARVLLRRPGGIYTALGRTKRGKR